MKSLKLKIFSLNLLFSTSLIFLFLLIKGQIVNYTAFLKSSAPKLMELQTALAQNITINIADAKSSIELMTKTATNFMFFQYLIMPLLLFALYLIFNSYIFYILSGAADYKAYLKRFILITFPVYLIFLIVALFFNSFIPIFLFLILVYLTLVLYLNLDKPIKKALKELLNKSLTIKSILIYLLLLLLALFYLIVKFIVIISIIGQIGFPRFLITISVFLLVIFLISLTEIWFSKSI